MYICNECNGVFDEPKIIEEHHPYGSTYATEYLSVCPYCDGDFQKAVECTECGEYIGEDDARINDDCEYLCESCYQGGE